MTLKTDKQLKKKNLSEINEIKSNSGKRSIT